MAGWLNGSTGYFLKNRHASLCLLAYLAVAVSSLYYHEPWRDELQCWVIAKESTSFSDLLHKARYEGHPSAWYGILYVITRFTESFLAVRICHLLLMAVAVYLLLFKSPFPKTQKCLLAFGYFFIFEYAALTRNYSLGILLLIVVCILSKNERKYWLHICGLLFLAMQVNVFATILSVAFFIPLFFTCLLSKNYGMGAGKLLGGALLFGAGFLLTVFDMLPPAGSTFVPEWKWSAPEWQRALSSFLHAFTPIPKMELHFWNSHILQGLVDWGLLPTLESLLALGVLCLCVLSLRKHPFALSFFLLSWLAITAFLSVKYVGFMRHHGHYFIAYVLALWIKMGEERATYKLNIFLHAVFSVHLLAALIAMYFDIKYPFTQSDRAARFIEGHYLPDVLLVGHFDYATSPVSFHLGKPIFYPNQEREGTFIYWDIERFKKEITDVLENMDSLYSDKGPYMLLTSYPLPSERITDCPIEFVKEFSPAVVKEEEYWLYKVAGGPVQGSESHNVHEKKTFSE